MNNIEDNKNLTEKMSKGMKIFNNAFKEYINQLKKEIEILTKQSENKDDIPITNDLTFHAERHANINSLKEKTAGKPSPTIHSSQKLWQNTLRRPY